MITRLSTLRAANRRSAAVFYEKMQPDAYHGAQKNENETRRHRDFSQITQHEGIGEANKSRNGFVEEIDFTYEHIGGFSTNWNLLQERRVSLKSPK